MRSRFQSLALILALALVATFGFLASASAQTPVLPGARLAWDQPAPSASAASGYSYLLKINALAPVVVDTASGVICGPGGPITGVYTCSVPFPAAAPGVVSTLTVAARRIVGTTNVDSPFSAPPFSFQLEIVPGTPTNIRIGGGPEGNE